jgi:hypothetical protein
MTFWEMIYNLSVYQWIGVLWFQFVLNYFLIRCWDVTCSWVYSYMTRNDKKEAIEMLLRDIKEISKDDDANTED